MANVSTAYGKMKLLGNFKQISLFQKLTELVFSDPDGLYGFIPDNNDFKEKLSQLKSPEKPDAILELETNVTGHGRYDMETTVKSFLHTLLSNIDVSNLKDPIEDQKFKTATELLRESKDTKLKIIFDYKDYEPYLESYYSAVQEIVLKGNDEINAEEELFLSYVSTVKTKKLEYLTLNQKDIDEMNQIEKKITW